MNETFDDVENLNQLFPIRKNKKEFKNWLKNFRKSS